MRPDQPVETESVTSSERCSFKRADYACTARVRDRGLCIFHLPSDEKDVEEFQAAVAERLKEAIDSGVTPNFRHAIFPPDFHFETKQFPHGADFTGAQFPHGVDFRDAQFEMGVIFRDARFGNKDRRLITTFSNASFAWGAVFDNARFYGETQFRAAKFGEKAPSGFSSFQQAHFVGRTEFRNAKFFHTVHFDSAEFGILFGHSEPYGRPDWFDEHAISLTITWHKCSEDEAAVILMQDAAITCFDPAFFQNGASFRETKFYSAVLFNASQFGKPGCQGSFDFDRATFYKGACFNRAEFHTEALFISAIFYGGPAEFMGTKFWKGASFEDAKFLTPSTPNFYEAQFGGPETPAEVRFDGAGFRGGPSFVGVCFYGPVSFRDGRMATASFQHAKFFANAAFHGPVPKRTKKADKGEPDSNLKEKLKKALLGYVTITPENAAEEWLLSYYKNMIEEQLLELEETPETTLRLRDLTAVVFVQPKQVSFKRVDLSHCEFRDTDVRDVEFSDVTWPEVSTTPRCLHHRRAVYDDPCVHIARPPYDPAELAEAERLYRQLKKNYEEQRMYGEVGDFHYGEMEMQRLRLPRFWRIFSLLNLYRLLSGYGERYVRAGLILLLLLLLFGALMLCGSKELGWVPAWQPLFWFDPQFWRDYPRAFLLALQVATFQRPSNVDTLFGQVVATVELIMIPSQVTLFLLAIRRKFKR